MYIRLSEQQMFARLKTRSSSLQYRSQKGLLTASRWSTDASAELLLSPSENNIGLALAFLLQ